MLDSEYIAHIDQLIGLLAQSSALGREIDLTMCVSGLIPNRAENRKVRDFVTRHLKINGREFDRALQLSRVKEELGLIPRTAREYIEAFIKTKNITAKYNGVLQMNETPYLPRDDGGRDYIPPNLWDNDEFRTLIRNSFRRLLGFGELRQMLRVRAAELRLEFAPQTINDASELWYIQVCRDRLWQIMGEIDGTDLVAAREQGQHNLRNLVERCFVLPEGVEFAVAVFNKFIWQVKRKIDGLPIFDHLMLVILGEQGYGKSTLIERLIEPVQELATKADFKLITDDRNITLWKNFVLIFNEMGYAKQVDLNNVKNAVTAETLTRRVMRTNITQEVVQNATFIGSANATEIGELICDFTGLRRFLGLMMRHDADWDLINTMDWQQVWQSVDHKADDPTKPFRNLLRKRQEAERLKTSTEEWVAMLDPDKDLGGQLTKRRFRTADLHTDFRQFEKDRFPGCQTSLSIFIREMKRLAERADGRFHYIVDGMLLWEWRGQ